MKGGITSGIVYPRLIAELAGRYRIRQVGGASAGAIAATMAAAAQAGQLRGHHDTFARLWSLPNELASTLPSLFQPSPATAGVFDVLMAFLQPGRSKLRKALAAISHIVGHASSWFGLGVAVAMVPAVLFMVGLLGIRGRSGELARLALAAAAWLPVVIAVGLVLAAVQLSRSSIAAVVDNGFGICDGHTRRDPQSPAPLTDWMETILHELVHTSDDTRPACFSDLWGAAATAAYRDAVPYVARKPGEAAKLTPAQRRALRDMRDVDCLVITTDLSHQRPYRFPFDTAEFFWCEECLAKFFSERVVRHMLTTSIVVTSSTVANPTCSIHAGRPLYRMPPAPDVPLVMAARVSLSFPGLISALPFQAVDHSRAPDMADIVTVWFSDGGISSNFPIRFFDAAWPQRPTFGINLAQPHPDYPQMVWRATSGGSGRLLRHSNITSLGGFLGAIFNSARNWADTTQAAMPGFRDRIVEVRQHSDEGGMNIQMPADVVTGLADRGAEAARNIIDGDPETGTPPFNFHAHRWMRYRNCMASLDELLAGMHEVYTSPEQLWQDFLASDPAKDFRRYAPWDLKADYAATQSVMDLAERLQQMGHPATTGTVPRPEPDLRLTPPL
ncbi:patatin-like phospholipase family protein [Mycolicibacterium neoaurum]|nr:patatin-like phospholipase family protein [Mycolicibacterium neoaurum]